MKLLLCTKCNCVRNITKKGTTCDCGEVVAKYLSDGLSCEWNGKGEILGFANSSFITALRAQRDEGDLSSRQGREFTAFIIPHSASSIKIVP